MTQKTIKDYGFFEKWGVMTLAGIPYGEYSSSDSMKLKNKPPLNDDLF